MMAKLYRVKVSGIIYVSAKNKNEAIMEARENLGREKYNIEYKPEISRNIPDDEEDRVVRGHAFKEHEKTGTITCKEFQKINEQKNNNRRNK